MSDQMRKNDVNVTKNPASLTPGFWDRFNRRVWIFAALLGVCSGCGYAVGNGFGPQIRSVSVPIFENKTYRRNIEYQLTEAVQKEIQNRSPYRLVKGNEADTVLKGSIVQIRKDVLGETTFDDPREMQLSILCKVEWVDQRSGQILATEELPISPDAIPAVGQAEFAPEVGASLATATQDAVNRMARKIVNMMENPW